MLGHAQLDAGMPARPIEHQHDLLGGTGPRLARGTQPARLQRWGMLTVVARWKKVRPEAGCTKPTR